jgi:hypothetical protein
MGPRHTPGRPQPVPSLPVLDHVFLDAVAAIRKSFDDALLERERHEDRLASDLLLGDLVWESSVSLPGEGVPPRVRADITLDWPTWSQTVWRSWVSDGEAEERPEIGIELVFRLQRLASLPALATVLGVLPANSPDLGEEGLERGAPVVELTYGEDLVGHEIAVEVAYEGNYRLDSEILANPTESMGLLAGLGSWVASTLVRLGDLRLEYLPPETTSS